jgi:hypothetical protein
MTKKETKEEEVLSKKHSKAVHVAKHTTPPLRPVPIANKAGVIPPPEDEVLHPAPLFVVPKRCRRISRACVVSGG